eukprot:7353268-Pyramimonas_sp.AAC.2
MLSSRLPRENPGRSMWRTSTLALFYLQGFLMQGAGAWISCSRYRVRDILHRIIRQRLCQLKPPLPVRVLVLHCSLQPSTNIAPDLAVLGWPTRAGTNALTFQAAEVCGGGTYPGDAVNPCEDGFTGTPIPEDSPADYRRTCYNASAEFISANATGLLALRCYSPSLDIGICLANRKFTYDEAVAECANSTTYNTTDWRLGQTVEEVGATCGR